MITILDYGCGNVRSVFNAFRAFDSDVKITNAFNDIRDASHIVLPGVGAFAECKTGLYNFNLVELLQKEVIEKGKPFLGICV
ncbi:MAG: imidazole glycerol phosphate synthase subunit HisH, partial [Caldithrix sp.]